MMSVGIEAGFSNDEVLNNRFPLHRACRDGDVGALCSLLQCATNQADLVAEDSFYGWTPIHWAAHFGKLECVLRLVQVGCEVNAVTTRFAQTPAHIAAFGGHPQCLLWLLQAGADINRQDYVGETPIHKAARAGSVECITALLLQGIKPDLRNANGQTAADLAHAQGFQECAHLLSNAQNQLNQLNGLLNSGHHQGLNGVANRKRLLDCSENNHFKKARTGDMDLPLKMPNGAGEEMEGMHVMHVEEPLPPSCSGGATITPSLMNSNTQPIPNSTSNGVLEINLPAQNGHLTSSDSSGTTPPRHPNSADMCGSLHLAGSPSSCVSHRPSWGSLNGTFASDFGDHLHYGHYHGFGDTAEDLEDASSRLEHSSTMRVEQKYNQALLNTMQLYHGS
ncbi:ankyrin repeat domain-containing protein 10a isoform X2 [Clupea harengus]|uniref:Ankyrin repeat domain-containing protein 10a isoform X2 n=1 Tax=Clupea harengus TaxID=7950 RepID=A0A6P3WE32_CLUHA|nr:ankyrin repeat domain-containing protein 10a isoform X2 [Clupea harengus]